MAARTMTSILFAICAALVAPGAEPQAASSRPSGVPEGAEAWLVLPAPGKTMARIGPVVEAVAPGSGPVAVLTLRDILNKYSGKALDQTKPVVYLFSLGKKTRFALGASIVAGEDVTQILEMRFGKVAKTAGGISTYLEVQPGALPDKEIYVSIKAGRLVVGDDSKLVALLAGAARPAAGAFDDGVDLAAGIDVRAASAGNKELLADFLKKLAASGGRAGKEKGLGKLTGAVNAGLVRSVIGNLEVVSAVGRVGGDEVSLAFDFGALKGGEFASALQKLSGARLPGLSKLPGRPMMKMVGALDPAVTNQLIEMLRPVLKAGLAPGVDDEQLGKELEAYLEAAVATLKHTDGKIGETVQRRAGGLCVSVVTGVVTESARARSSVLNLLKAGQSEALKKKWQEVGLSFEIKERHRKSRELDVDRITIDIKPPVNPDMPPEVQARVQGMQRKALEALYGLPSIYEFVFREKRMLATFGKEAPKALDELVESAGRGEAAGAEAMTIRKRIPEGAFLAAEIDVIEYAHMLVDMMGRMMPPGMMPNVDLGAAPAKPAGIWAVARDGKLTVQCGVPVAPVKRIFAGIMKARKEMNERIRQQRRPVPPPDPDPGVEQF